MPSSASSATELDRSRRRSSCPIRRPMGTSENRLGRKNLRKIVVVSALCAAFVVSATPASARQSSEPDVDDAGSIAQAGQQPASGRDGRELHAPADREPVRVPRRHPRLRAGSRRELRGHRGRRLASRRRRAPVPGNDPFPLHSSGTDANVLALPSGSSAVSAPTCVDLNYPHFRLAVNQLPNEKGKYKGRLKVETMYPNSDHPQWRKVDTIRPDGGGWIVSDFLDLEPERGGHSPAAVRSRSASPSRVETGTSRSMTSTSTPAAASSGRARDAARLGLGQRGA